MDQEIIIEFQAGTLRINGGPASREVPPRKVEVSGYPVRLINVPLVDRPGLNPIEHCPYYDNLSEIMLLEETEYQVLFEARESLKDVEVIPHTDELFTRIRFKLGDSLAGILNFRSYAGKSFIGIETPYGREEIPVEVRSKKINYHEQYPAMLADLSDEISSLILEASSSIFQTFTPSGEDDKTLYEDFLLLEYLFRPENLPAAAEHINHSFYSGLEREITVIPAGLASVVDPDGMVGVLSEPASFDGDGTLRVLPQLNLRETPDTPENRFYRYFLESVEEKILSLHESAPEGYIRDSLEGFLDEVNLLLSAGWLKDVGDIQALPMNSQVLQKREGYRDVLRYFFMLDLALRFTWDELQDSIRGFERRLSELYEYWCYFRILRILEDITGQRVDPGDIFVREGWKVRLRTGNSIFRFRMDDTGIALSYNGRFRRNTRCRSYSLPFRPDYSILVDVGECTYFIHLDAKYRSMVRPDDFHENIEVRDAEEELDRKFRDGDVYKMHTYKDAILHSVGAYILYPGDRDIVFAEGAGDVPSVGAFPLRPGESAGDERKLRDFIKRAILNIIEEK
ncbi:DUF2357 domain-containing protein [Methanothermobacter sp. EMTCatA1]|jgi:hypothetical protein|uniref:DUF2357 domain-containing protein n=1 Tax=Methanothermobacter sp. EMTCatA1 TaxID=2017966 RepID=UPI000B5EA536|nr:DUF2357 domain-containing protein [Methanothermobacter sp. EMTCatA1]BAZ98549.1 hypothetical protein tca_00474 [Methanothermobacter sp. EMTCatA1]